MLHSSFFPVFSAVPASDVAAVTVTVAALHNSAGHELTIKFSAELA